MRSIKRKVWLWCEDPLLRDYLRRVLEQCPTLEVVCSPLQFTEPPEAAIIYQDCLTPTEIQLLQKVADCGSIRQAAEVLHRSENTLKRELQTIREKLGVGSTLAAVVWALRKGVIQ